MENELPDALIEESVIQTKMMQLKPHYIKPIVKNISVDDSTIKYTDADTGTFTHLLK